MTSTTKPAELRKLRLAKALKANIARRKAQAQAQARIKTQDDARIRPEKPQKS
jgi:ribosomal protein L39E